jgi:hypothetical protein
MPIVSSILIVLFVVFLLLLGGLGFGLLRTGSSKEGKGPGCFGGCLMGCGLFLLGVVALGAFILSLVASTAVGTATTLVERFPVERVALVRDVEAEGLQRLAPPDAARPLHLLFDVRPNGDAGGFKWPSDDQIERGIANWIEDLCECDARVYSRWDTDEDGRLLRIDVALPAEAGDLKQVAREFRKISPFLDDAQGLVLEFRDAERR